MLSRMIDDLPQLLSYGTLGFLLRAALMTIALTALGCGLGFLFGFLIAFVRQTRTVVLLPFRILAITYVEVFRRIPFLVTLFLILFIAQALVPGLPIFIIAAVAICIMSTAYLAEIIRAGLEAVPRTQVEAAATLNFGFLRTMVLVVVPQAWTVIMPPAVAYVVMFVKDTALASQVGVFELLFAGKSLINRGLDPFLVYFAIMVLYFAISYPLAIFGKRLEARLSRRRFGLSGAPSLPAITRSMTDPLA